LKVAGARALRSDASMSGGDLGADGAADAGAAIGACRVAGGASAAAIEQRAQHEPQPPPEQGRAGGGGGGPKVCYSCGVGGRKSFSKKQWARVHGRKCLACSARTEAGTDVLEAGEAVANGEERTDRSEERRDGAGCQDAAAARSTVGPVARTQEARSPAQPPASLEQQQHVTGPLVNSDVLAVKARNPAAYPELRVFVDEECPICLESWQSCCNSSAVVLNCHHAICVTCFADWCASSTSGSDCPSCRAGVSNELVVTVRERHAAEAGRHSR
jgi:hypothetical protein